MPILKNHKRLDKELKLFDVYAISTGAMFSSGFFLLPGLASAEIKISAKSISAAVSDHSY
jgi:hypothetical protein